MKAEEILQKETYGFEEQSRLRDDVLDAMEKYAKQRVIEELEKMMKISTVKTSTVPILSLSVDLINRIEELKQ